ncbi:MAG: cupin domain-containing protein [Rhodospirillales bacterium]|tara:strand:+ start:92 stop:919 length:828 start_codon:yes stop_codon:yes gene_type:complete
MPVINKYITSEQFYPTPTCCIRSLLTKEIIGSDRVSLDHITLSPNSNIKLSLEPGMIGWIQFLDGIGKLDGISYSLTSDFITYLPQNFLGYLAALDKEIKILFAKIPDAKRFDKDINLMPSMLNSVDWTREPILESEHDARKRIYMATKELAGTHAFKGEMITYPPDTSAPEHHHIGAEHFQYIISGEVTALLNGEPHSLKPGDVLYNYENEPHTFINESNNDFSFVEFFIPGPCKTIWSPGANVCAWLPTGVDSVGRKPVRDIGYHIHGEDEGL